MNNKEINNKEKEDTKNKNNNKPEEASLPSLKEESKDNKESKENQENKENKSLPTSETKEEKSEVKAGNQTLNPQADFSQIFNVASEEQTEVKEMENKEKLTKEQELAPEVKIDENTTPNKPIPKFNKDLFNSEEKLLYEIKPEKEGNPIVVLLFFTLLITFIILLPIISKNDYELFKFLNNNDNTEPSLTDENDGFYELGSTAVRVSIGDLELNNFVHIKKNNEYFLTFTLTNTKRQPYLYDKKYYVVLYDGDNILYRALIHSYDPVSALGAAEVNLVISERAYNKANRFKVEEIDVSHYPDTSTIEMDGEYDVLTCKYLNDEIKYYFANEKLARIKETYKETTETSVNFETNKNNYKAISDRYKKVEHFSSTFVETATEFTMINDIELKDIQDKTLSDLQVYRFFKYNENINIVSFELEAQGYTCG